MTKPTQPMSPPPLPVADRFGSIGKVSSVESMERQCITMDLTIKDALTKGALMDRVRSLENRLLQLCLELELHGMSLPDMPLFQAFKETSSLQRGSNTVGSSSTSSLGRRPKRNQPKLLATSSQASLDNKAKVKNKSDGDEKKMKKVKQEDDEPKKNAMRSEREKNVVVTRKKGKPSSWFHLKLLGC